MPDAPRDYETEYQRPLPGSLRERIGFDTDRGELTRFVVQLEYRLEGEWTAVVRYDHDGTGDSEFGHDVTEEGLHVDIYRDGEKHATEFITGPLPGGVALDHAEDHLAKNLQRYVKRFEEWHGIRSR
ncbi:DUF7718 family protein [Halorientalis regularis]|uniref:DUF7718 domain-containing protein n=1 Tax=Halorientalis regularis TaxID=660518 RepID=A0A1G7U1M2_9EURY|nr:hypothetical protein [Halorientalis regularis]SDG41436.1 hypothetical protein SAMN05216218_13511 [Halorientalis regularis]